MRIEAMLATNNALVALRKVWGWVILYQRVQGYKYIDFFYSGWR
jgi:hypothetical protein